MFSFLFQICYFCFRFFASSYPAIPSTHTEFTQIVQKIWLFKMSATTPDSSPQDTWVTSSQSGQHEGPPTERTSGLTEETGSGASQQLTKSASDGIILSHSTDTSSADKLSPSRGTTEADLSSDTNLQKESIPAYPFGDTVYPGTHTPFRLSPADDFIHEVFAHTNYTEAVDEQFQLRYPAGCAAEALDTLCYAGAGRIRPRLWTIFST